MPHRPLPLNAVYPFLVTARHLNLTHAARELNLTQGAVSRKIAALESWLGFALFERHARGLRLTLQGSELLPELQRGYQQMEHAAQQACQQGVPLRLRAPTCALRWLLPKLVAIEKQHPGLHIALTSTLEHRRQLDQFDAAILYGKPSAEALPLFSERLTPVMAPTLLTSAPDTPQALAGLTFLHPTETDADWQLWLKAAGTPLQMKRNQHFATMDLAIGAAIQGYGVTVADVTLVSDELSSGRLIAPFAQHTPTGAVYSLLQRRDNPASRQLELLTAGLSAPR